MKGSIFPKLTLDRSEIKWEEYLHSETPVHLEENSDGNQMWFKREDFFAPLGYGSVNGGKLRQCIILMKDKLRFLSSDSILISGASIKSPQLPIATAVAAHFRLKSVLVLGATKPETALKAPMVRFSNRMGAKFDILKVGYNPVLQSRVNQLFEQRGKKDFLLNYGISNCLTDTPEERLNFHSVVAEQVRNMPLCIERLILPAGSCNSSVSILFGISKYRERFPNLKEILLLGIGPDKTDLIESKLNFLKHKTGIDTKNFQQGEGLNNIKMEGGRVTLNLRSLHDEKYASYGDEMKFSFGSVDLHPTYEGKMMNYLYEKAPQYINSNSMFWVVGSKTEVSKLQPDEKINLYA